LDGCGGTSNGIGVAKAHIIAARADLALVSVGQGASDDSFEALARGAAERQPGAPRKNDGTDYIDETNQVITVDTDGMKAAVWSPSGLADSGGCVSPHPIPLIAGGHALPTRKLSSLKKYGVLTVL
jgi:hypothetical protein